MQASSRADHQSRLLLASWAWLNRVPSPESVVAATLRLSNKILSGILTSALPRDLSKPPLEGDPTLRGGREPSLVTFYGICADNVTGDGCWVHISTSKGRSNGCHATSWPKTKKLLRGYKGFQNTMTMNRAAAAQVCFLDCLLICWKRVWKSQCSGLL